MRCVQPVTGSKQYRVPAARAHWHVERTRRQRADVAKDVRFAYCSLAISISLSLPPSLDLCLMVCCRTKEVCSQAFLNNMERHDLLVGSKTCPLVWSLHESVAVGAMESWLQLCCSVSRKCS